PLHPRNDHGDRVAFLCAIADLLQEARVSQPVAWHLRLGPAIKDRAQRTAARERQLHELRLEAESDDREQAQEGCDAARLHAIQISTRSQLRWVARLSVLATRDMPRKRRNTFGAAPFVRLLSETRNCKSASAC